MTSDRTPTPAEQRLIEFADLIFRGKHASRTGIDPEQAELIVRLKQGDRVPPFDATVFQPRKEHLMSLVTTAPAGAMPGSGTIAAPPNGKLPYPMLSYPRARSWRPTLLQFVSAAVLLALIGGLIFGITQNRNNANPTIPAVIQGSPSPEASPLGSDWGQFRGGVERTGYSTDPGPGGDLHLRWSFSADESLNGIMEAEGKVVAYGSDGTLYVVDALTGEQLWAAALSGTQFVDSGTAPLPVIQDGVVYASNFSGVLSALDANTGEQLWTWNSPSGAVAALAVEGGEVFLTSGEDRMHVLDQSKGVELRSFAIQSAPASYPTIDGDRIYFPGNDGDVYALDRTTGEVIWNAGTDNVQRLAALSNGRVFVPTVDGALLAIDANTGKLLWRTDPLGPEALNPVVTDSIVVLAVQSNNVRGFDPATGDLIWTYDTPELATESPHGAGSTVYLNIAQSRYEALDLATGKLLTQVDTPGAGSTAAISGQMLFVSGVDGPLRAFGPGQGNATSSVATPPAVAEQPSAPAKAATPVAVAPVAGDIQADLVLTLPWPMSSPMAMIRPAPDGSIWWFRGDNTLHILDRDGNLIEERSYQARSPMGEFQWLTQDPFDSETGGAFADVIWLPDGRIAVVDPGNGRIQFLDQTGKVTGAWGSYGSDDGQFITPIGLALSPHNEIAVVDIGRDDVQWFDLDGHFLRKLTTGADGLDFVNPIGLVYDSHGNFWVLDNAGKLSKYGSDGQPLFWIGNGAIDRPGYFSNPPGFTIDDQDRVWVADQWNYRVQVFDPQGNLLSIWDACNTDANCFRNADILLIGGNGFVYVDDYDPNGVEEGRLMKFHITSMPEVPMMAAATPAAAGLATPVASPVAG
jgi:outer membrane protein assembly factor BamB